MVVAALACGYDIVPGVGASDADRSDVVAGKVAMVKSVAAVETKIVVAAE